MMTTRFFRVGLASFFAFVFAGVLFAPSASALPAATITLQPTSLAFSPGTDATVRIRVEGNDPEGVSIDIVVQHGTLSGVIAPNLVSVGVAQGMAFVRRETGGTATVGARIGGVVVASTQITFAENQIGGSPGFDVTPVAGSESARAPSSQIPPAPIARGPQPIPTNAGTITIALTLESSASSAARTWSFEVVDSTGSVVDTVLLPVSGDAPRAAATTKAVTAGRYSIRPKQTRDLGASCSATVLFEINGAFEVTVPAANPAAFSIHPCSVSTSFADTPTISTKQDDSETPRIDRVAGVREPGIPLPPNTGSGVVSGRSETPGYPEIAIVMTLFVIAAIAGATWLVADHFHR